ncbi:condensation domain-containing protein [Nocardia caishijiensis]|uniref:Condensation domain-containing protein n=1 Tax=Nocardia caishijiensis TaxID=184756 RepID=A0ABQ6YHG4_9NOCA|nr:condensation domain-containing protein [Nocardia caishijiensis]KAF0845242.1 condensation domain-containing protein [Nocardia caishijiensis]
MEFTELADYPLRAGTVIEWVPVTGPSGTWQRDERPLSHLHEQHCARSTADEGESSWLGTIFEIPLPFDEETVRVTLRRWMARHDAFRTTATADEHAAGRFARSTCRAEDVHVMPRRVGHLRTGTRVYQHLTHYFGSRLSPTEWPHCLLATVSDIEPTAHDGGFLLVFGADHSVMDAYSMMLAISEIQRLYQAVYTETSAELPDVGSYIDFGAEDRALGAALTAADPAVRVWRRYLRHGGGRFPAFPLPVTSRTGRSHPGLHQSGLSSWVLTAEQTEQLQARCRGAGHSVQSAVFAALAATHRVLVGSEPLRCAMPVHTRHTAAHVHAMGWYVGLLPLELDHAGADTLAELLDRTAAAIDAVRPLARLPFPRIAELLGCAQVPRFVVSYVDVRHVPDATRWQQWQVRPLRSGEQSDEEVYFWIARSPGGLAVSARFPSNEVATANVHRFINTFTAMLSTVTAEGALVDRRTAVTPAG